MSYDVKYKKSGDPIGETPMDKDMIFGNPSTLTGEGCTYSGLNGYPKADDGIIKEVVFDQSGPFGDFDPVK